MKASTKRKPKLRTINQDHACHAVTLYLQALSILDDNEEIVCLSQDEFGNFELHTTKKEKND